MGKQPSYSWRARNRFTLLVDAAQFYPAMLDAIDQAQHFILFEQYLVSSGRTLDAFIEHLHRARARGVTVLMLLDGYGSSEVSREDYARLQAMGVLAIFFNPLSWRSLYRSLKRDHRKLLAVDNEIAFVGGAGLTDEYLNTQGDAPPWHDVMLKIHGEVVADWTNSFLAIWRSVAQYTELPPTHNLYNGDQAGRLYLATGPTHNDILRSVIARSKKTTDHIWIATPYFVTSRKFRGALRRAAHNGIDVRLLLPGPVTDHPWISHASRRYYRRLLRDGVRIFEYQPRFIHAKIVLCDEWVSIGSSNLDRWNHSWNLDANQAVHNSQFSEEVRAFFERDFAQSQELTYTQWNQRSLRQRLRERFYGHYVTALHWFSYVIKHLHKAALKRRAGRT